MAQVYDIVVVGGGIVGLGTALALKAREPQLRLAIAEKGARVAGHQTGHNSGVIHSGLYYKPGSLKAQLCVEGGRRMVAFCQEHAIPYRLCGKVVVATETAELDRLAELHRRGTANGVPGLRRLGPDELKEIEPHAAGVAALHVPSTGIVDYTRVSEVMAELLKQQGVDLLLNAEVTGVREEPGQLQVTTGQGTLLTRQLINCAGLHSDRVARLMGVEPDVQIVPFRGEYYFLRPERANLVRGLIYPVPDPALPFLGVHLTSTVHGRVEAGPNAVLALAREGYTRTSFKGSDLWETLRFSGFQTMARRFWRTGCYEYYRSFSKRAFARSLQKLLPAITVDDLAPGGAGVRAQAITSQGALVDDFRIVHAGRASHVLNAPSPAATASLAIGEHIAQTARETFARAN
jgi:(S)-2-hydroxyglutarate dehydrogenase